MREGTVMTRILVIDDDRGILRLIERTLQKEGYDVTTVEDPEKLEELSII